MRELEGVVKLVGFLGSSHSRVINIFFLSFFRMMQHTKEGQCDINCSSLARLSLFPNLEYARNEAKHDFLQNMLTLL